MAKIAKAKFVDILDREDEEIERPKPVPQGSYVAQVNGQPRFDINQKTQNEFVEFTLTLLQPLENEEGETDVDTEALANMGGLPKDVRTTYYLTENAAYRVKEFCNNCGVPPGGKLRARIEQCPGSTVGVHIKHEPSRDKESGAVYANVTKTFAVE